MNDQDRARDVASYDGIIVSTPGTRGGKPRIDGSRIAVVDIVAYTGMGMSVSEIVDAYPPLTAGKVEAALAYYEDHQDEIDASIEESERFVEEYRRENPSLLQQKLKENPALVEEILGEKPPAASRER